MRDWFVFDVGLSLAPVALVWLGSSLVGRWSGWSGPLRDGQLCFFSAALAAVAIKDVIRLGRTVEAEDSLARLARGVDTEREAAVCRALGRIVELEPASVGRCLRPAPDVGLAVVALISCLLLATFVFGVVVTENSSRSGPTNEASGSPASGVGRARLLVASVAIAAVTLFVVGSTRVTLGVWP